MANCIKHKDRLRGHLIALIGCLGVLLGKTDARAADAATLISVAITNGTVMMPRTMFTQTWTFQNTGTTTWAPAKSGYTLNIVGSDSLGAVPLTPNTFSKWYIPCSAINSGKSVAPGAQGSFSLSFIAPETPGPVSDTFTLSSTTGVHFGPTALVSIVVAQAGSTNQYDRARAISYANNYAGYVCSDGYFWTNGSYDPLVGAGMPVPTATGLGDDCAHFVSSCIGQSGSHWGGGLHLPSRTYPCYGEPAATSIVNNCLLWPGYAVEVFSLTNLSPGDLIGWNWEGDTNVDNLDHVTLYLGNGLVASHSQSALDVSATTWFQSGEPNWKWHLIHILDVPTITSFKVKNNLVLSWGTNWSGYALYSAPSLSPKAAWTKMAKNPSVVGTLNHMTNTMAPGAVFYRLMLP